MSRTKQAISACLRAITQSSCRSSTHIPSLSRVVSEYSSQTPTLWCTFTQSQKSSSTAPCFGFAASRLLHTTTTTTASSAALSSPSAALLTQGLSSGQRKALTWWLGGSTTWVFAMVVLGGYTRLTRSGLSMTDWKFTGERPPSTEQEWQTEFSRYKQSPEYQKVNKGMTVDDFKFIYWVEWGHRMWGRSLGLLFAVPAAYFASRGMVNGALGKRLGLLFLMGGTQGFVGWWMVRSGLMENPDNQYDIPRVSPYRLAAHLTSAFAIYTTLVWTTLGVATGGAVVPPPPPPPPPTTTVALAAAAARKLRRIALPLSLLIGITAVSGAFVAGLDAGHAYNTFPTMNGEWIPSEYSKIPGWRNAFENTAAVQLHHRLLALSTLTATVLTWRYGTSKLPHLSKSAKTLLHVLMAGVSGQVTLGVTTLLTYVPVELGSAHQAGALTLFTIVLGLLYTVHPVGGGGGSGLRLLSKVAAPGTALATLGIGAAVTQME